MNAAVGRDGRNLARGIERVSEAINYSPDIVYEGRFCAH